MKYFDVRTVVDSYKGFQNCMTNKSWGYLALLKGCNSSVRNFTPYKVDMDVVSNFLEDIFNLSQEKRHYNGGHSLFVVFSNKWDKYFKDQGEYTPNIFDVAVWAYRRKAFPDNVTNEDIVNKFSEEFNIPFSVINSSFNIEKKDLSYGFSLYSESVLNTELEKIGVDVSKSNIDAKKSRVVASPGEISRGPFIQPLYAGLDITDYVLILQSDYNSLYGESLNKTSGALFDLKINSHYRPYITAIKSKPFLLLAGISGTGKSRIVRELARACWDGDDAEYLSQKPRNFEMIQVKPNWHDSSELIGYVSRVSGTPMFVAGDFLKFIARAWEEPDVPYFLCLDEMNLAPVEQYFAEYLSVIESRKADADGNITTDPILKKSAEDWFRNLTNELTVSDGVRSRFLNEGISIPQNLIVVGTVNMDETTFSFSRKVLDRAMTIEMNEVDLHGGLSCKNEQIGKLGKDELVGTAVEGVDIYESNKDVCDKALDYLQKVNDRLEGTPFKIAYRTRNEVLLYVVNNLPYKKEDETQDFVVARALDEITNMKILSRIEGDETKVSTEFLNALESAVKSGLEEVCGSLFAGDAPYNAISLAKLGEMKKRLASGYTSFWN